MGDTVTPSRLAVADRRSAPPSMVCLNRLPRVLGTLRGLLGTLGLVRDPRGTVGRKREWLETSAGGKGLLEWC